MNLTALYEYSPGMTKTAGILIIFYMIIGIIGNLLTFVILLRHSKLRTVAAAFIASLSISDLLICFLVLPFSASQFINGKWIHGDVLCVMIPVVRYGSIGVSLISISTISINRYILIVWPHLYPKIYTKLKVTIYISIIWLFSYCLQIPILLGQWGRYGFDKSLGTCSILKDQYGNQSKTTLFEIAFTLPFISIIVCYANIYWVVRNSHKRLQNHSNANKCKHSEMKITKMILVIFVCFILCYLPITMSKIFDKKEHYSFFLIICYLLIYLSPCINPIVYVTMNKQYRQAYLNMIKWSNNSILEPISSKVAVSHFKNAPGFHLTNEIT